MVNPQKPNVDGEVLPDGTQVLPGRARIIDLKTAKDGRRYASATGAHGRTVVIWGRCDSTDEELRVKADEKLPSLVVEAPPPRLVVAARRSRAAVLGTAALVMACCLLALLGAGLIAGYRPVVLTTASMSPTAPAGSLLIAETVEPESVSVGDILVMRRPSGVVVTHRVVERVDRDGLVMVRTKGDANEDADPAPYSVVGTHRRSEWVIPSAGKVLLLLRTKLFRLVIVGVLALLIVGIGTAELRRLLRPQPLQNIGSAQPQNVK